MKRRYLVLLASLAFGITLVLHAPASLVYAWTFGGNPDAVVLHGVQGTLSHGRFDRLTLNRRPLLSDATWELQPAWLALLRFTADLETGGDTVLRGRISRAVFGTLRFSDLSAAGSVKALLGLLGQAALPLEGQARLEAPLLRLDDGIPVEAEGGLQLENLAWTLAREPLPLGSFTARFGNDDKTNAVVVTLASGPGPLELDGRASLAPDRKYEVALKLRPRPEATAPLQALLRSLGPADPQGWYHLRRNGQLQ